MNFATFVASILQANILQWLLSGAGHAFVQAVAGSGKSTMLEWIARKLVGVVGVWGVIVAYNRHIATELQGRLQGTNFRATTVHSHGYKTCAQYLPRGVRLNKNDRKYSDMVFPVVKALAYNKPQDAWIEVGGKRVAFKASRDQQALMETLFSNASKLVKGMAEKGRLTLTNLSDPVALDTLVVNFDLEPNWAGKLIERREFLQGKVDNAGGYSRFWSPKLDQCRDLTDMMFVRPDEWLELRQSFLNLCASIAAAAIQRGFETFKQRGEIDFTDMIWMPVTLGLAVETAPYVFADEVQDFSPLQRAYLGRMIGPQTRGLFVGDADQSIYAFTGADVDSVKKLVEEFDCTVLPLSVTYRCPRSVVALARSFQDTITPRDGAPLGIVDEVNWLDFAPTSGDLVLCRTTRPLVATCWHLLQQGIPAYVEGKTIGAGLSRTADTISSRPDFKWADFMLHADGEYEDRKAMVMLKNGGDDDDERIDRAFDDIEACKVLWGIDSPDSLRGFERTVARLFGDRDENDDRVTLCTAHRAKGLEADHVFLLKPQKMPHVMGCRTPSGAKQESNLQYVTVTRAKRQFTFITGEDPTGGAEYDKETGAIKPDFAWAEATPFIEGEDNDLIAIEEAVQAVLATDGGGEEIEGVCSDCEMTAHCGICSCCDGTEAVDDDEDFDREAALEQMDDDDALALERREVTVESIEDDAKATADLDESWTEQSPEYQEQRLLACLLVADKATYTVKVRFPFGTGDLRVEGYANGDSVPAFEGFWGGASLTDESWTESTIKGATRLNLVAALHTLPA